MWHVTYREAVFQTVIHTIFDRSHYEVLWTYALTTLLWYTCDFVCWIVYIMLYTTNLKASCQMHVMACSQVHSEVHSEVHYQFLAMAHFQLACLMLSSKLSSFFLVHSEYVLKYTPNVVDYMLPSKLSRYSQIHSEYTAKYTSEYDLKYTLRHPFQNPSNCTRWHPPSLLDCTLPIKLSRCSQVHFQLHLMVHSQPTLIYTPKYTLNRKDTPNLTWLYDHMNAPACSIQKLAELQMSSTGSCRVWPDVFGGRHVVCGWWQAA
jgi:hypothetical protein